MLEKNKTIAEHRIHAKDTGSADVQIALLTEKINSLTEHLQKPSWYVAHGGQTPQLARLSEPHGFGPLPSADQEAEAPEVIFCDAGPPARFSL
jgi:hypothetical protein